MQTSSTDFNHSRPSPFARTAVRQMKAMDVFARMLKVQDDLQTPTAMGGLLSIASILLIVILVGSETSSFLTLDREQKLSVDTGRNEKLTIYIDIDFYNLNCEVIGVDALDGTGNAQLEISNHMFKTPINHKGTKLKENSRKPLDRIARPPASQDHVVHQGQQQDASDQSGESGKKDGSQSGDNPNCGSCMGAELDPSQCCNTCADVRKAYEARGWLLMDLSGVPQCVREGVVSLTDGAYNPKEGCNVHGYVEVLKVAGVIHLAPGHSFAFRGRTLHDMSAFQNQKINLSHRIKLLSFGEPFPGSANPLDGTKKIVSGEQDTVGQYQYFSQVVPTTYQYAFGSTLETNQYSVTESFLKSDGRSLPGVFLYYNLSPIKIEVVESRRSIFHFLVQLSAIVGGVFSVASMLDAGMFHSARALRKRAGAPLGKLA